LHRLSNRSLLGDAYRVLDGDLFLFLLLLVAEDGVAVVCVGRAFGGDDPCLRRVGDSRRVSVSLFTTLLCAASSFICSGLSGAGAGATPLPRGL